MSKMMTFINDHLTFNSQISYFFDHPDPTQNSTFPFSSGLRNDGRVSMWLHGYRFSTNLCSLRSEGKQGGMRDIRFY